MKIGTVLAVLTGLAVPFSRGRASAIAKRSREGPVAVGRLGFDGDEQGDRRFHGGADKAVLGYAWEHYRSWRDELGPLPLLDEAGAFGENLSTEGIDEEGLCLGDRLRVGSAVLEVSQARQPCWKLNDRFGDAGMARRVQRSRRTGWYCRVLRAGSVSAGDDIELVARPHEEWPLTRLMALLHDGQVPTGALRAALGLPLVASWRARIERRLDTGVLEDSTSRLDGPSTPGDDPNDRN